MTTETPKEGATARLLWWLGVLLLVVGGALATWSEFGLVGVVSWWCAVAVAAMVFLHRDGSAR